MRLIDFMMLRKLDPDLLLSQMLIWLLLIGYIAIIYTVVMKLLPLPLGIPPSDFAPPGWLNLLVLAGITATSLPVNRWIRASVRELIYSQQDRSHPALTRLNQYLESSASPNDLLPTIAETIASTLKLPYVEIEIQPPARQDTEGSGVAIKGKPVAYGTPVKEAPMEEVALSYHEARIGELRVCGRRAGEELSPSDRVLLAHLAQQVGIALYAAQLSEEIQRTREKLVIAREEERRRIRNDLHDGLAPTLSSLQLQLGAIRNTIRRNPDQAETLINELREDIRNATAEIRQLVYDLRPALLDELGLVGAMRNSRFQGSEVRIEVSAPESMPKLSAAVEVAAYRIASEALHNVVKHAQATRCEIRIELDGGCLVLKVSDNGKSLPGMIQPGVGLRSMKERAAELGGSLAVQPLPPSGTCVTARIPLESGCTEV